VKTWTTQFADVVTVGDQVALGLLGHPDAHGVISDVSADGKPVVKCFHCGAVVTVEDFNLSMLIKRLDLNRIEVASAPGRCGSAAASITPRSRGARS
jgi:hypothetical protein